MSDLSSSEKRKLERLLGMSSGYVLNFSNRTFSDFVEDECGRDIYDARYNHGSGSKANRLRGFWTVEPNHMVAKLTRALIDSGLETKAFEGNEELLEQCRRICDRLEQGSQVQELDALSALVGERDFEAVAKQ